jgi:cytochrome P450
LASLTAECQGILNEWASDTDMSSMWKIRGAATRIFIQVLAGVDLPAPQADAVTFSYVRRFAELSLFARYFTFMLAILGTRQGIRRDAYFPLRRLGVDNVAIDMTLFAAMFSVGTIVMKSAGFAKDNGVDYRALSMRERMAFVVEAVRLCPTVTSVHRILEEPEMMVVAGISVRAEAGDEFAYPFVCINRDPAVFSQPETFNLNRPMSEVASVLSWSSGKHICPAKDLSVLVTTMMLDALSERFDFRTLTICNLEF